MALFRPDFNRPGPGVDPNAPRKKGLARLWEIFSRDTLGLLAAGALAAVSSLVYIVSMMISIDSHGLILVLTVCPLGGMLAAPQICGLADTILRALRDEPGYWWSTYRRAWRQNVKGTLLPGAFGGLLFGFQMFILAHADLVEMDLFLLAAMVLGVMLSTAIATWLVPQLVLMELPLARALLNAMLMCVGHPLKTLAATLLQLLYWAFIVITFPFSSILFLLVNFWLPELLTLMLLYPVLDDTFHIEEGSRALQAQRYPGPEADTQAGPGAGTGAGGEP